MSSLRTYNKIKKLFTSGDYDEHFIKVKPHCVEYADMGFFKIRLREPSLEPGPDYVFLKVVRKDEKGYGYFQVEFVEGFKLDYADVDKAFTLDMHEWEYRDVGQYIGRGIFNN